MVMTEARYRSHTSPDIPGRRMGPRDGARIGQDGRDLAIGIRSR